MCKARATSLPTTGSVRLRAPGSSLGGCGPFTIAQFVSLECVNTGRGTAPLLAVAAPLACTEVSLIEAELFTCTPPAASSTLLSIERARSIPRTREC
jgi:hypothetical protein